MPFMSYKENKVLQLFTINIKQKWFTKVIKNAKQQGLGWEILSFTNLRGGVQELKWRCRIATIKSKEC